MKERLKKRPRLRLRSWMTAWFQRRSLRRGLEWAAFALGSGVLSLLEAAGAPLLVAACVAPACTGGAQAAAMLGSTAGYLLAWGVQDGLWPAVLAVVLPVIARLLARSPHRQVFWFLPAACTLAAAAVGLGFLWQLGFPRQFLGQYFLGLVTVFLGCLVSGQALQARRRGAIYLLGAALLAGLSTFSLGGMVNLGISGALFLTAVTSAAPEGIAAAAACGVVLELMAGTSGPYTAFFCLCSAVCYLIRSLTVFHRGILILALSALFAWLFVPANAQLFLLSAILGTVASLALPRLSLFSLERAEDTASRLRQQLQRSSDVLLRLHDTVLKPHPDVTDPDAAAIFDHAADHVCRSCPGWALCWEQENAATYRALCSASGPILQRCKATQEDFPPSFVSRCSNLPAFLQDVNTQLDAILYRRQYQARQQENRQLLRSQYLLLARYLQAAADAGLRTAAQPDRFDPEVAARAVGRSGHTLSGDRGACFHGPGEAFYVLLCDGMGTGRAAAAESSAAIETLTGLLRAGLDPGSALELLNGAYVLRDDGCFSTVDLLQVNLASGDSLLLKWGAAPSYLKRGQSVRRLGEATLPPGLSAVRSAQRIRLTLQSGDLVVLTSDGASALETERRISEFAGQTPQELAAGIIDAADPDDDITAVAICMREPPAA